MSDLGRQFRFLIPPFLFLLSLSIGLVTDGSFDIAATAKAVKDYQGLIVAAIAGSTIPLGYLISVISLAIARELFRRVLTPPKSFEDPLTSDLSERLWSRFELKRVPRLDLALQVIYGFRDIPEPVRGWIDRRWSTFVTLINLVGALLLAHATGILLGFRLSPEWNYFSLALAIIGVWQAWVAFHQIRGTFDALLLVERPPAFE